MAETAPEIEHAHALADPRRAQQRASGLMIVPACASSRATSASSLPST